MFNNFEQSQQQNGAQFGLQFIRWVSGRYISTVFSKHGNPIIVGMVPFEVAACWPETRTRDDPNCSRSMFTSGRELTDLVRRCRDTETSAAVV